MAGRGWGKRSPRDKQEKKQERQSSKQLGQKTPEKQLTSAPQPVSQKTKEKPEDTRAENTGLQEPFDLKQGENKTRKHSFDNEKQKLNTSLQDTLGERSWREQDYRKALQICSHVPATSQLSMCPFPFTPRSKFLRA